MNFNNENDASSPSPSDEENMPSFSSPSSSSLSSSSSSSSLSSSSSSSDEATMAFANMSFGNNTTLPSFSCSSSLASDEEVTAIVNMTCENNNTVVALLLLEQENQKKRGRVDMRGKTNSIRGPKRQFCHEDALAAINRDYLSAGALFGKEFEHMFRISKSRFERLRTDVMNANIPFYTTTRTISGKSVASLEARLLLPLKAYAY